jgi:S1-C subfamily serine protease
MKRILIILGALALVAVGIVIGTAVISSIAQDTPTPPPVATAATTDQTSTVDFVGGATTNAGSGALVTELENIYAQTYQRVSPSVVAISVELEDTSGGFRRDGVAQGSGFVIDTSGHIVTNYHVVQDGVAIEVNFFDGVMARGTVVGEDPDSDIAVIKVDLPAEQLFPVTLGDSNQLTIGQMTLAIGSPFGERWTLTTGIVSALGRQITGLNSYSIAGVIQTDAAINPGNSGGPLFNLQGQVIGVNAQIASASGVSSGVGYAIPINLVKRVAQELIAEGRVRYSYMGIRGGDIDLTLIENFNLADNQRGAVVVALSDEPALGSGLQGSTENRLEIITAINGTPILSFNDIIDYLAQNTRPGDTVTLTILRGNETLDVQITLAERP